VNWIDPYGLDIWHFYDEDFVTHSGVMVGQDGRFTYYSFQPKGFPKPSGEGYMDKREFSSFEDAMEFAKGEGYDKFAQYETSKCDDERAREAADDFIESDDYYEVLSNNCQHLVNRMMNATGAYSGLWRGYGAPFWAFGLNLPLARDKGYIR